MKKATLKNYARLIAVKGANIQKGQPVIIRASLDQPEFVTMLTDECYKAGASRVRVEWDWQPLEKVTYRRCKTKILSEMAKWEIEKLEHQATNLPAMIYLESEDPDGLKGIDQKKVAEVRQARYRIIKPIRDKMENKYQWCIAAVPGEKWAKKVFPDIRVTAAMKKLWEMILFTSRADGDDPVRAWNEHNADLHARCSHLNALRFKALHYTSSNGTDLTVGMIPEAQFLGGSDKTVSGIEFNPNIPSEEAFISPMKGKAEGTVVATKPLSYQGEMIENFRLVFKEGKVVELHAEKNEELLRTMVSMDESAGYLGECALVPEESPINRSGVTFFNTLFDENACCHLALGAGFENCIEGFEYKTLEECREMGINDSIIHVDFMIGCADLSIDGIGEDGKTYPIFRKGTWAF